MVKKEVVIDNQHTGYFVDVEGNIYNKRGRKLNPFKIKSGYLAVDICVNKNRYRSLLLHRLIYTSFLGDIPKDLEINHIDGDKQNAALINLESVTHSENCLHSFRIGFQDNSKDNHPGAKINSLIAQKIKDMLSDGIKHKVIANKLNISIYIIKDISRGKTWV